MAPTLELQLILARAADAQNRFLVSGSRGTAPWLNRRSAGAGFNGTQRRTAFASGRSLIAKSARTQDRGNVSFPSKRHDVYAVAQRADFADGTGRDFERFV